MDLIEFIYLFFLNKNLIGINSGNNMRHLFLKEINCEIMLKY